MNRIDVASIGDFNVRLVSRLQKEGWWYLDQVATVTERESVKRFGKNITEEIKQALSKYGLKFRGYRAPK